MNFNHLNAFFNVAKYKSFTQAANELNVSASTLSLQVKNLEQQYDIPLLKRTKKAVELTDEGEIAFSYAQRIFSIANEMENTFEDFSAPGTGKLRIGATLLIANYFLPNIVSSLTEIYPKLKFNIYTDLSKKILSKVIDFEIHVGIIGRVIYPGNIICKQITRQKLCFVTNKPMKENIWLQELSNYPLIMREEGSATREYLFSEFSKRNILLRTCIECENTSAIKRMVSLGMGGAFFPEYSIKEDVRAGRFRRIEILDELYLHTDLIYLKERKKSKILQKFITSLSEKRFSFPEVTCKRDRGPS
jgi:DNA-binding transcriptional LysR family regulator